jgi:hypothetical protein
MKMPLVQIETTAAQDESRPILHSVYFNAEKQQLVSANGFSLSIVPVEVEEGDVTAVIPLDAWTTAVKAERKATGKKFDKLTLGIQANKLICPRAGIEVAYSPVDGNYPPYWEITDHCLPIPGQMPLMTINVELLHDLTKALCEKDAPFLTLYSRSNGKIYAQPIKGGSYGVVMMMQTAGMNGFLNPAAQIVAALHEQAKTGDTYDPIAVDRQAHFILTQLGYDASTALLHPELMSADELCGIRGVFTVDGDDLLYSNLFEAILVLKAGNNDKILWLKDSSGIIASKVLGKFSWGTK